MKKISTNSSRKIASTNKYKSWVICMLLIVATGMQSVNAQTYNLLPAASTSGTVAGTTYTRVMSGTNGSGCAGKTTPLGSPGSGTCTVNFTGGTPVYYVDLAMDGADYVSAALYNREIITVNGVTHTPSLSNFVCNGSACTDATKFSVNCYSVSPDNYTISGNYLQAASGIARGIYRVSSAVPITQIAITEAQVGNAGGVALGVYIITGLPTPCNAGTTAPTLSASTIANVCPATTVDLTTITASNLPGGATLTWHTATPATTANKIATPSAVAAGTYYAAFFDATGNCYSGTGGNGSATTAVTATVGSCSSPTSCVVSGVTITTTGTTTNPYSFAGGTNGGCPTSPFTGSGAWSGGTPGGTLTYTFSSAVTSATVRYTIVNGGGGTFDRGTISVNGGGTPTLSSPCGFTVTGLLVVGSFPSPSSGDASITVTSTLPFTTVTVTNATGITGGGFVQGNPCDFTFTLASTCNAGTTAPTLSATTKANVCPATTVDLTTITASNLPASTTLTWHTATPATTANKVTGTAVAAGTYYAAFFDATNNCYSGTSGDGSATTVVTATTTACAGLTASNPSIQTVPGGQVYTGNAGTELAPTGGTGPYTYSNGSSDPACINPGGATALPPASNLTVTNSTTGAYTYTAPTVAGTYFFCIKVCDSTTPTPNCVVKTYTVVVPCAAGSTPPVLIKN